MGPGKKATLLVLDATDIVKKSMQETVIDKLQIKELVDPYWIYYRIFNDIIALQDEAVWKLRDFVRTIERSSLQSTTHRPNYRQLHDLARHAIHIVETMTVTNETIRNIKTQHESYTIDNISPKTEEGRMAKAIHDRFLFYEQITSSFQHRASSTKDRLANEIQLSFNIISQQDSSISLQIGRIAQIDSASMKTIAFLTLTFLPATFVSAVFSMSFFNFSPESNIWAVSDKFWVYWVVAIPATVLTPLLWRYSTSTGQSLMKNDEHSIHSNDH
jgi:Mg2+ and Co2+ transporter CorA